MRDHDETIRLIMREEACSREEAEAILADALQAEAEDGGWRKERAYLWIVNLDAGTIDGKYPLYM